MNRKKNIHKLDAMKIKKNIKKMGELLCDAGLITSEQLQKALAKQQKTNKKLGEILVEMCFISHMDIAKVLALQLGIQFIDFSETAVEPEAIQLVPEKLCRKHTLIPLSVDKKVIKAVFADPLDLSAIDELRFASGRNVQPCISTPDKIREAIAHNYHINIPLQDLISSLPIQSPVEIVFEGDNELDISDLIKRSETAPVIAMVNSIIINAVQRRASDIHIEPQQKFVNLRMRIDGLLKDIMTLPKWVQCLVISRIKIMAKMDISEKRIPQDGRIKIRIKNKELDLRVSSLPTQYGENIVIRILDMKADSFQLENIGLGSEELKKVISMIDRSQGMILLSGPTGSGKTSTLYAMLNRIKSNTIHIVTLEDPIEYEIPGISQVNVNEKVGLTFAFSLRSILRQDPDAIMVGEIRDVETACIAAQASITGHLVLSSVHTNSTISTITRLKNMGVPSYLISSSLNGIISQRLVRLICPNCKTKYNPSEEEFVKIGLRPEDIKNNNFYKGTGCQKCSHTGYSGRIGVFEVLTITPKFRELINNDAPAELLQKEAINSGMKYMIFDGLEKVKKGLTTLEELNRVLIFEEEEIRSVICPNCNSSIKSDFINCPFCGITLSKVCPSCGRQKEENWKYCPYCKNNFQELNYA
ncbi:MAG: type II secretion system protein GspE [Candidatus Schekmanbacteria bacterium]|nr:MAG: type II secretion system protein GspE [Candidatus Schekmanbacteria bacterium]